MRREGLDVSAIDFLKVGAIAMPSALLAAMAERFPCTQVIAVFMLTRFVQRIAGKCWPFNCYHWLSIQSHKPAHYYRHQIEGLRHARLMLKKILAGASSLVTSIKKMFGNLGEAVSRISRGGATLHQVNRKDQHNAGSQRRQHRCRLIPRPIPSLRRLLRAYFANGCYVEGWAEYIAGVMMDEGYLDNDPRYRLIMRKIRLRVLANTILDIRMHTLNMSDEEAMDLMTKQAFQTQAEAQGKLQRSKLTATQLPTYYVGIRGWNDLRAKYKKAKGAAFTNLEFHNRALDLGAVPLPVAGEILLGIPSNLAVSQATPTQATARQEEKPVAQNDTAESC